MSPRTWPLVREDAPQRSHALRGVFDVLRWVVRTVSPWRHVRHHDLPPWEAVYQQMQRWIDAVVRAGESLRISNLGI